MQCQFDWKEKAALLLQVSWPWIAADLWYETKDR